MTVFVDNAFIPASVPDGPKIHSSRWCHLVADSVPELIGFARRLGLRDEWLQDASGRHPHYDLTLGKRLRAVRLGAVEIEYRDAPDIARAAAVPEPDTTGLIEAGPVSEVYKPAMAQGLVVTPGPHSDLVQCVCSLRFYRPKCSTATVCLRCETEYWLADAGMTHDHPALRATAAWNAAAYERARPWIAESAVRPVRTGTQRDYMRRVTK